MGEGIATEPKTRRRRIIERPRLTRLLDESQGRIKMLVAPAGYGKTTLARQWLEGKQAVWYTATPASVDVAALAAGLQQSVATICRGAGEALLERIPVTRAAGDETQLLAGMLTSDLLGWPAPAWLVIDDYQELMDARPAEDFVELLASDAPLNLLLLTRERPRWASSRRVVYGELFELGRPDLAMTDEEATALFGGRVSAPDFVSVAQGWPAVIALAAVLESPPPDLTATPHLHRFFADEIYRRLDRRTRRQLCELALYDVRGREIALQRWRVDEAESVIAAGVSCGFLTESDEGRVDVHPLLRSFLLVKLREERPRDIANVVERGVRTLLSHRLWDEAFALITQFERDDLIPGLLQASMDEMLSAGRTATLATWLQSSPTDVPVVRVAMAELAFREGRFYESEALAALAASELASNRDLATRANLVAGRAAHVASRETQALRHYQSARESASDAKQSRQAAFGELLAMVELEDARAADVLETLASERTLDPVDQILLADRTLAYETRFSVHVDLTGGRAARQLLKFQSDPVARASFRNILGYALASTAHFDEATEITDEQLHDAARCRLDFVIPYSLTIQALVSSGMRSYAHAESLLDEAEAHATRTGDVAAVQCATAVRMRVLISQAAFDAALARSDVDLSNATRSLRGELLAVHALALAGAGHTSRAVELASSALGVSLGVEAGTCANSALAVVALNQGDHKGALRHASSALRMALDTGMIEPFVSAYRGCPELIVCLLQERAVHDDVKLVVSRAGDDQLIPSGSLQAERSVMSLSPREKEVFALLAQGQSNAQIGKTLFISPVTVKVHVRHIYEKLGVRSRAAAVLRATQLGRD